MTMSVPCTSPSAFRQARDVAQTDAPPPPCFTLSSQSMRHWVGTKVAHTRAVSVTLHSSASGPNPYSLCLLATSRPPCVPGCVPSYYDPTAAATTTTTTITTATCMPGPCSMAMAMPSWSVYVPAHSTG